MYVLVVAVSAAGCCTGTRTGGTTAHSTRAYGDTTRQGYSQRKSATSVGAAVHRVDATTYTTHAQCHPAAKHALIGSMLLAGASTDTAPGAATGPAAPDLRVCATVAILQGHSLEHHHAQHTKPPRAHQGAHTQCGRRGSTRMRGCPPPTPPRLTCRRGQVTVTYEKGTWGVVVAPRVSSSSGPAGVAATGPENAEPYANVAGVPYA